MEMYRETEVSRTAIFIRASVETTVSRYMPARLSQGCPIIDCDTAIMKASSFFVKYPLRKSAQTADTK
jgi:hypothetical protein